MTIFWLVNSFRIERLKRTRDARNLNVRWNQYLLKRSKRRNVHVGSTVLSQGGLFRQGG